MNDATSEPGTCAVCGDQIRPDNREGICSRTPECHRRRMQERRETYAQPFEQEHCKLCGDPLSRRNRTGYCGSRKNKPECYNAARRERRKNKDLETYRVTIKAGDTFGQWTVLEDYSPGDKAILVRCECGTERRVRTSALIGGTSRGCGCSRGGPDPLHELYLTAGSIYGRLTVLRDVTYNNERVPCRCECGTETTIIATSVKLGLTKSCDCLSRERSTTHGFYGHPFYALWNGIIDRCTVPKAPGYHNYGGRGITVCEGWRDPWAFAEDLYREIGPRPEGVGKKGYALYSLDRKDNDGGYWCGRCAECTSKGWPFNVQWSTRSEQLLNQRKVSALTREVLRLTGERDALAAELAALRAVGGSSAA
jgi:hypothetical protein